MVRTTLRLDSHLKKAAEKRAYEQEVTLQAIFNQALEEYLNRSAQQQAKLLFHSHNLGQSLDNLRRQDYYDKPS